MPTPQETIVVFPEPLRKSHPGRRVAAVVCLCGALGAAGWLLIGDFVVGRANASGSGAAARDTSAAAIAQRAAQSTPPPLEQTTADSGVDAFEASSYETATRLLRRALLARGTDSLDEAQRVRALTFLGAAELLRGRRDSSTMAFRRLLVVNPNRPPDPAVFPPEVTDFYDAIRSRQNGVVRIATTSDGVTLTVVALSPHDVSVGVGQNGSASTFLLFQGEVRDSVVLLWNGRTPTGAAMQPGSYELVLMAKPTDGKAPRSVRFPVVLERESVTGALHARAPAAPASPGRSG